jgi:alkanesulfonate monooxygenase SsuD/methylene tetrahydromethanopterin reductase-like flavin-dependent oxidoreductase (luciferase family)
MASRPMRFGLYLPPMGPLGDPATLVDLAVRAERAGWDGVFLWDHVLADGMPIADAWTTLAGMAVSTKRILIGPMVTPVPRRRPWVVARQAMTVSALSHGRLVLGVGLGVDETGDLSSFEEDAGLPTRRERLMEGMQIIRGMWAGDAVDHLGNQYRARLPAEPSHPYPLRVWMASSTGAPGVLGRAAECDGIFHNPSQELTADDVAALAASLRERGVDVDNGYDIVVRGNASHAWPAEHHVDLPALVEAGATWWLEALIYFDPLELSREVVDAGPPRQST